MVNRIFQIISIAFLFIALTGCSSGNYSKTLTPVLPEEANLPFSNIDYEFTNRTLLGLWQFDFNPVSLEIVNRVTRDLNAHFNVKPFIPAPSISVVSFDPLTGILDVDFTINNTSTLSGYDVRLILFTEDTGVRFLNADNWTNLWDIPGGAQINPFKAYAKDYPLRYFPSMTQLSERIQLYLPYGNANLKYAIDASFPANCEEPYKICNFIQDKFYDTLGFKGKISVDVYDWQNDIDSVSFYCPPVLGVAPKALSKIGYDKWALEITNDLGTRPGNYSGYIIASSANSFGVKTYLPLTFKVSEDPITDWTALIYITEENLGDRIQTDINEMEVAGSRDGDLNIIVCWNKDATPNDIILKIERDPDGYNDTIISTELDDAGEVIPPTGLQIGDEQALENFLKWGMRNYPARKYIFIPFGHGSGPFSLQDPNDFLICCGGLQIWEVRDACRAALDEDPQVDRFEVTAFSSCLMSWIETAYTMKSVTKTCVASEWIMYASTLQFADFFGYLLDNIRTCTNHQLASLCVDNYLTNTPAPSTLAAWDSDMIDSHVVPALNAFSQSLIDALPAYRSYITSCVTNTGSWGYYCSESRVKDLGLFATYISVTSQLPQNLRDNAQNLINMIDATMINHGHNGTSAAKCPYKETGWQIWLPSDYKGTGNAQRRSEYALMGFDQTTWDDFLFAYDVN